MDEPPLGPTDNTTVPRYAGIATFAQLPRRDDLDDPEAFAIAVVGAPFDGGTSYRPGARFGPSAIRQASRLLRPYNPAQDASPFALGQVVDAGDVAANPFSIPEALEQIEAALGGLLGDGRRVVTLGGDHTIALPALRAVHAVHGPATAVLLVSVGTMLVGATVSRRRA